MHIGHNHSTKYHIEQDNQTYDLDSVDEEKDLGVITTHDLKFSKQCNEAAKKAMRVLGLVKRYFRNLDIATFRLLYKSFIRLHLEYSVQAWSPCLRSDIDCLEKVQRRATKLVQGFQNMCYEERLRRLDLTTLEKRRIRGDLIETFKIVTNRENIDSRQFFTVRESLHELRGHRYTLYKPQCHLSVRQHFFSHRVINSWNSLPDDVVSATSVNSFKSRVDKCSDWGI